MKLFTKIFAVALLASTFAVNAQDGPELTISGSIDTYFRANLNGSNNPEDTVAQTAPGTSFANGTGFSIGMANLVLGIEGEKTGFVADLVFGPRGNDAVFESSVGSTPIVNQLYGYWNATDELTVTLGNFNTFLGYEVISPAANFNYSTSYMFSYGPFSHTGLKLDYAVDDDLSFMLSVMNPTDITETQNSDDYVLGAQVGFKGIYLNGLYSDDFYQVDLTAGFDVTETVYVGVNATTAKESFLGAALYLQNSFSDDFSLGLRGEYFSVDEKASIDLIGATYVPAEENVIDLTLSANYSIGDLTIIPEVRVDLYSEDVIIPEAGESPQNSLASFLVAAVYAF